MTNGDPQQYIAYVKPIRPTRRERDRVPITRNASSWPRPERVLDEKFEQVADGRTHPLPCTDTSCRWHHPDATPAR